MIANLPKEISPKDFSEYEFGNADAISDKLLSQPYVFCSSAAFLHIQKGEKRIITGDRGAGKTAMFRLISEGKIKVKSETKNRKIIPIQADINLKSFRDVVAKNIRLEGVKNELISKYRIVWELYLLLRLLEAVDEITNVYSEKIIDAQRAINSVFQIRKKVSIMEMLLSVKKTFGFKVDANQPTMHNFYTTFEPGQNISPGDTDLDNVMIVLDEIIVNVNEILKREDYTIDILIDKLDDFTIREEYEIQKSILQSLLDVEMFYSQFSNIRLFVFIRDDLFNRLKLDELGPDKVLAKRLQITWSREDITQMMAKRLIYNYFKILRMDSIGVEYKTEDLIIDKHQKDYIESSSKKRASIFASLQRKLFKKVRINRRIINLSEEVSKIVIETMLPTIIKHVNGNEEQEEIDIYKFIETHIAFGNDRQNPRMIINFLNKVFEFIVEYYEKNADILKIECINGRYEILSADHFIEIYSRYKKEAFEIFLRQFSDWSDLFLLLNEKKGKKYTFKYQELIQLLGIDGKKEKEIADFNRFLAFLSHIGYIGCDSALKSIHNRKYVVPVVFR